MNCEDRGASCGRMRFSVEIYKIYTVFWPLDLFCSQYMRVERAKLFLVLLNCEVDETFLYSSLTLCWMGVYVFLWAGSVVFWAV